jgi:hypothetical protein
VSVLGGRITIATLIIDADGTASLDRDRTAEFALGGRDQQSVRDLHAEVGDFVHRMALADIHLRLGPSAGPKMAKVESHICEGVLYLLASTRIVAIPANSLGHWMQCKGYEVSNQARDRYWEYALATAACAAERAGVEVKLSAQE